MKPGEMTINESEFRLSGMPFRIISGAMHYFRCVPEYWEDRLRKLRGLGLNTVETYVAWNLHEPRPGEFHFNGMLDIERFVRIAADLGLKVIVRPGPYICSEWDFGGLPAWLLKDPAMRIRCAHPAYLAAVDRYFDALLPRLAPLQVTRGGPIIAMQVENEYGSYGDDKTYLRYLADGMRARDIDVLLFTSDGAQDALLQAGTLPDVLKTVNFGSRAALAFETLRRWQPTGPLMCTEFWLGWFDHWGGPHHSAPIDARVGDVSSQVLDDILSAGASVNLYMAHGGTNFGFMNGANNHEGVFQPDVTSYDYAAPIDEAGDPSPRYTVMREVIGRYAPVPDEPIPAPAPKRAYGEVAMSEAATLSDALSAISTRHERPTPEPMESFDQGYGFILYRTRLDGPRPEATLHLRELRDRAQVFLDGRVLGVVEREAPERSLAFDVGPEGVTLDILVENQGRVNYGPDLLDRKGITEGVLLDKQYVFGWEIYPLPLDNLQALAFAPGAPSGEWPAFYRGVLEVDTPADTFLALPGWTKGVAWINGFNLGRYWSRGPQQTLYVPAPLLRPGANEVIVFELHRAGERVSFVDRAQLG